MPGLNQDTHFKGNCNNNTTAAAKAKDSREKMRTQLAKELGISESEYMFCLCEAITIIIPIKVNPHKDSPNDPGIDYSGTVAVNCLLPIHLLNNKANRAVYEHLVGLGYTDQIPCTILFYSRKSLQTYEASMAKMYALLGTSEVEEKIFNAITNVEDDNSLNYCRIFDHPNVHSSLVRDLKQKYLDNNAELCIEVPRPYDMMVSYTLFCFESIHCLYESTI